MSAHSLFLQYFLGNTASHSQSLPRAAITPFLPYLCSSSTTCTKRQLQNQWFSHSSGCSVILLTVTRIASSRRQSHGVSTAHLKPFEHPERSLSPNKMCFPRRRSGAAAEIGSANASGWIRQLLQLNTTAKFAPSIFAEDEPFCWAKGLGFDPYRHNLTHCLKTLKNKYSPTWVWRSKAPSVSKTTPLFLSLPVTRHKLHRDILHPAKRDKCQFPKLPTTKTSASRSVVEGGGGKGAGNSTLLVLFVTKGAEKCPIPCTCVQPHHHPPCKGASVSKFDRVLSSLSSSAPRCLPKGSSTPPITVAFTSLLCLVCSSLTWSICGRFNWLQSCCSQGKIRSPRIYFFFKVSQSHGAQN